jgi:hypothetical protein
MESKTAWPRHSGVLQAGSLLIMRRPRNSRMNTQKLSTVVRTGPKTIWRRHRTRPRVIHHIRKRLGYQKNAPMDTYQTSRKGNHCEEIVLWLRKSRQCHWLWLLAFWLSLQWYVTDSDINACREGSDVIECDLVCCRNSGMVSRQYRWCYREHITLKGVGWLDSLTYRG